VINEQKFVAMFFLITLSYCRHICNFNNLNSSYYQYQRRLEKTHGRSQRRIRSGTARYSDNLFICLISQKKVFTQITLEVWKISLKATHYSDISTF